MGLARVGALFCAVAGAALFVDAPAGALPSVEVDLWADRDDDDVDGQADGEQPRLPPVAFADLVPVDGRLAGTELRAVSGGDHARLVGPGGIPLPWGRTVPTPAWFQGLSAGRVELQARLASGFATWVLNVTAVDLIDGDGETVDPAKSHASIERIPPGRLEEGVDAHYDDFDALRVAIAAPASAGDASDRPREVAVESINAAGVKIDALPEVRLTSLTCRQPTPSTRCWASAPLRFVNDDVDRNYPLVADRSLRAEVGGAIVVRVHDRKAQAIRVLGPRASPAGPIGRLRASLRAFVLRVTPGGAPSVGGSDAGAVNVLRAELGSASAIWGQCGVTFGDVRSLDVRVVDPPPSHLVALGDGLGMSAGGGEIRLRVDG
ncbi:MAG TPA: hypothetical protein VKU41_22140, partial [Polyangiaceae bacterium]|nr:hypothetical protein [Polyangiaceae bacterium]